MLIASTSIWFILGILTFAYFPDNWDVSQAEPTCSGPLFWVFVLHKRTMNTLLFTNWGYAPERTPEFWALFLGLCSETCSFFFPLQFSMLRLTSSWWYPLPGLRSCIELGAYTAQELYGIRRFSSDLIIGWAQKRWEMLP